jgi:hypothetical protein
MELPKHDEQIARASALICVIAPHPRPQTRRRVW